MVGHGRVGRASTVVSPELGLLLQTGLVISMVVIGGMGTLTGPLLGGLLVVRRVPPSTAVLETFVSYRQPVLARIVWTAVAPIHRAVVPYLLRRAATASAGR